MNGIEHRDPDDASPPKTIGSYRILDWLGKGGMGEVYRANDTAFDRELALKFCKRDDDNTISRFLAEARLIAQLQHPAIPPLYHLGQDSDGHWFYAMKRVRGRTLGSILEALAAGDAPAQKSWHLNRLIGIVVDISQAMGYAHARGVIHRDLKPSNIMIGDYGDVYVMDWGLAKALGRNLNGAWSSAASADRASASDRLTVAQERTLLMDESPTRSALWNGDETSPIVAEPLTRRSPKPAIDSERLEKPVRPSSEFMPAYTESSSPNTHHMTLDGQVLGTLHYMAPEQAKGLFEAHDQRTDIYSIGVMLWEILLGERFRAGDDRATIIREAASGHRPDFLAASRGKQVEPILRDICLKALEAEPDRRYQGVQDLAGDLQKWLDGEQPWKIIYDRDFSGVDDEDGPPAGWKAYSGGWCMRGGALSIPEVGMRDAFVFFDTPIHGDVRVEIEGWIEPGFYGELSICLACADSEPSEGVAALGGYLAQFGCDYHECSKICRSIHSVTFSTLVPKTGRRYRVMAELLDGVVRLEIDGEEILRLRDLFPLAGSRVGFYDYSGGAKIRRVRIWTPGVPKKRSCLAVPNAQFSAKQWQHAMHEYDLIRESYPGSAESDEACFKSALCLLELARFDESRSRLESLRGSSLAPLCYIGLSRLLERQGGTFAEEARILVEGLRREADHADSQGRIDLHAWAILRATVFRDGSDLQSALEVFRAFIDHECGVAQQRCQVAWKISGILKRQFTDGIVQLETVVAAYQRLWDEFPNASVTRSSFLEASDLYRKLGRYDKSRALIQLCMERFPFPGSIATCYALYANIDLTEGLLAQAHANVDRALEMCDRADVGKMCVVLETKGHILRSEGRLAEARAVFVNLLGITLPEDPDFQDRMRSYIGIIDSQQGK